MENKNKKGVLLLKKTDIKRGRNVMYLCKCNLCGSTFKMWSSHFYRGSNGCECKNHKKNNPRLYSIWVNMKTRCFNEKTPSYKNYGARGVTMCDEWANDFSSFYEWAISNGYREDLTIDRKDVNGNYEPSNCRWSNLIEQANNKRNNIIIQGKSLRRFCVENNMNYKTEHTYISRYGLEKWARRRNVNIDKYEDVLLEELEEKENEYEEWW